MQKHEKEKPQQIPHDQITFIFYLKWVGIQTQARPDLISWVSCKTLFGLWVKSDFLEYYYISKKVEKKDRKFFTQEAIAKVC